MTPKINCSLVEHWLYLAIDGELSPELEVQLEAHLDGCQDCQRLQAQVVRNEKLLGSELESIAGAMDVLLEGRARLLAVFGQSLLQRRRLRRRIDVVFAGLAIVFLAIIFDRIAQSYGKRMQQHLRLEH